MSDDEYRAFHAYQSEQNYDAKHMPDWIEDDHLVQTNQRWVELPDCASAADASRPLAGTVEDGHNGSSATCKSGTHWQNTPAAPVVPPVVTQSGLGTTRPF